MSGLKILISMRAREPLREELEFELRMHNLFRMSPKAEQANDFVDAVSAVDLLVAVLPRSGAFGRSTVMFDLGVAVALGTPIVVIGYDTLPSRIAWLPSISDKQVSRVRNLIDNLLVVSHKHSRSSRWLMPLQDFRSTPIDNRANFSVGPGLESLVLTELQNLDIQVAASKTREDGSTPDLAVWDPNTPSSLGQPIALEVRTGAGSVSPRRFKETLDRSGVQTLVVVHEQESAPKVWAVGNRQVLSVSARPLLEGLRTDGFAETITNLLRQATR